MAKKIVKVNARKGIVRIPETGTWLFVDMDSRSGGLSVFGAGIEVAEGSKCHPACGDICAFGPFRSESAAIAWFKRVVLNKSF